MIVLFDNYFNDVEELGDYEGFWFEDAMYTIEKAIPEAFIVKGKVGRWNRDCSGCKIYTGTFLEAFGELMDDCDYVRMYVDDDGVFNLEGDHHDGHNHFVIKNLTKEGFEKYEEWSYDWDDTTSEFEIKEDLFKNYTEDLEIEW